MQDTFSLFKISGLGYVKDFAEKPGIFFSQDFLYFFWFPNVEFSFFAFTISVLGRIKPSFWMGHIPFHILKDFSGHLGIKLVFGNLISLQISLRQDGLVVEHFLEVGDQPRLVRGVAGKSAPRSEE